MNSILNPTFRYTRSEQTDIRKTFARVRKELAAKLREEAQRRDCGHMEMDQSRAKKGAI